MSDFDKEAEREKLREKFARDEQKRAQTSRMSELLLKGATMTNKHHDCGSPIFRWKGEEFCPSCQGGPGGEPQATGQEANEAQETPAETEVEVETESANGTETSAEPGELTDTSEQTATAPEPTPTPVETPSPEVEPAPAPESQSTAGGGVDGARASLERTLAAVARQAEATEDLSRKRDYLAAAKEAAEALEAVKRAER